MKKSNISLLLALTLPVAISLTAASFGLKKPVDGEHHEPGVGEHPKEGLQTIKETTLTVGEDLSLSTTALALHVTFDPALHGQAKVKVEARAGKDVEMSLQSSSLSFAGMDNNAQAHVTLVLPATLAKLHVDLKATKCDFSQIPTDTTEGDGAGAGVTGLNIGSLESQLTASRCEWNLGHAIIGTWVTHVDAGKLDVSFSRLESMHPDLEVNAGSLNVKIDEFSLPTTGPGPAGFKLRAVAGQAKAIFGSVPEHALTARLEGGELVIDRAGTRKYLKGSHDELRFESQPGAPEFDMSVTGGELGIVMDTIRTAL